MSMQLTRRQLLNSSGIVGLVSVVGGLLYHSYTGPLDLEVQNFTNSNTKVEIYLSYDGEPVLDQVFQVPPRTDSGPGNVIEKNVLSDVVRGTNYTLAVSLPNQTVDSVKETHKLTCTGFSEIEGERLSDRVGVDIMGVSSPTRIVTDTSYCSSVF